MLSYRSPAANAGCDLHSTAPDMTLPQIFDVVRIDRVLRQTAIVVSGLLVFEVRQECDLVVFGSVKTVSGIFIHDLLHRARSSAFVFPPV